MSGSGADAASGADPMGLSGAGSASAPLPPSLGVRFVQIPVTSQPIISCLGPRVVMTALLTCRSCAARAMAARRGGCQAVGGAKGGGGYDRSMPRPTIEPEPHPKPEADRLSGGPFFCCVEHRALLMFGWLQTVLLLRMLRGSVRCGPSRDLHSCGRDLHSAAIPTTATATAQQSGHQRSDRR